MYEIDGHEYVSRVIAMTNERVTYMDDVLYRNDVVVDETYLDAPQFQEYYTEDLTVATITDGKLQVIPRDYFLVLNDNRTNKDDSRTFGLIPKKNVIGRLTFRISPLSNFGFIKTGLVNEN